MIKWANAHFDWVAREATAKYNRLKYGPGQDPELILKDLLGKPAEFAESAQAQVGTSFGQASSVCIAQ